MRPQELILRCFAERTGDQWVAFCIDLNLAAQADTFDEAHTKLEGMVKEYVYDALAGEDRDHAPELMRRKAPLGILARYHCIAILVRFAHWKSELHRIFQEKLPLCPPEPDDKHMNHA